MCLGYWPLLESCRSGGRVDVPPSGGDLTDNEPRGPDHRRIDESELGFGGGWLLGFGLPGCL